VSILTGKEIRRQIELGRIKVEPFDPSLINPNSIDVRLGPKLLWRFVDWETSRSWAEWDLSVAEFALTPRVVVLGSTLERTFAPYHVPVIEGKSSLGRQFVSPHFTAGYGDVGFDGQWTLELHSLLPFVLKPGMKIGQIAFHTVEGEIVPYAGRYAGQTGPTPARREVS
jgi:dCTP deaminase